MNEWGREEAHDVGGARRPRARSPGPCQPGVARAHAEAARSWSPTRAPGGLTVPRCTPRSKAGTRPGQLTLPCRLALSRTRRSRSATAAPTFRVERPSCRSARRGASRESPDAGRESLDACRERREAHRERRAALRRALRACGTWDLGSSRSFVSLLGLTSVY